VDTRSEPPDGTPDVEPDYRVERFILLVACRGAMAERSQKRLGTRATQLMVDPTMRLLTAVPQVGQGLADPVDVGLNLRIDAQVVLDVGADFVVGLPARGC
jgi:hypothetical protein